MGLPPKEARLKLASLLQVFKVTPDPEMIGSSLLDYAERHQVSGRQIHDARLALTCELLGLDGIITYNKADFARYTGIRALEPVELTSPSA